MKLAMDDADISTEEVDYINAHGTSTPLNDLYETKAIKEVFKEHAYRLAISSTKSMTGHMLGAAGAVEAIVSLLAIKEGIIPPTINMKRQMKNWIWIMFLTWQGRRTFMWYYPIH